MQTIWKFPIKTTDRQGVLMPRGAEILCVQVQINQPCLWARIPDTAARVEVRAIYVYGTGHMCQSIPGRYIGTYQLSDGHLIFHVFEEPTE